MGDVSSLGLSTPPARQAAPVAVRLADYRPPTYLVRTVELTFKLDEQRTEVTNRMRVTANPERANNGGALALDGEAELTGVAVDGVALGESEFTVAGGRLTIPQVTGDALVTVTTVVNPAANTSLMGLYSSGGALCTQCEAEGFRRITFFPDRPDVMAVFTVTITADAAKWPVLLSNGNLIKRSTESGARTVTWHDPHPKPCYLFALVAGDFAHLADEFTTASGRRVDLRVFADKKNIKRCAFALSALKKAMTWDEKVYGREYDLDTCMIVAVDDFNMGAMENKGLNIFNTRYVLADEAGATDDDFAGVESVIAHEYFHNWSGNRVTCRDWFQLSLKEGFTVFRDQQFTADHGSPGVKRIEDADLLRTHQFREDAGPMRHPVQPDSYQEISNFYTLTVYNKGAEVVRMMHGLMGAENFRRGADLYFARHDGCAVTIEQFVRAQEEAGGVDLGQFRRWYHQAGTPKVTVERFFDPDAQTLTLDMRQQPALDGQKMLHIPLRLALLDDSGAHLPLHAVDGAGAVTVDGAEAMVELKTSRLRVVFDGVQRPPLISMLRGFSAPVTLVMAETEAELARRMAVDSDSFNRWDAAQRYACKVLLRKVRALQEAVDAPAETLFHRAFGDALASETADADPALLGAVLTLPDEIYLGEQMACVDTEAVHRARLDLRRQLAAAHADALLATYQKLDEGGGAYRFDSVSAGRRRLRNVCLGYLALPAGEKFQQLAVRQFARAANMTDTLAALGALANSESAARDDALAAFYRKWRGEPLAVAKWLAIQAASRLPGTLARVRELRNSDAFALTNPNKVYALLGTFAHRNPLHFHVADGRGYRFIADCITELDPLNPQVAARLALAFSPWRRYDPGRQAKMQTQMRRIMARRGLSRDTGEIVGKSLDG